ncbi:hypothetical protein [Nitrospirillum sp. BR 11828]|uniref:hypothetical protein n=1 Tax=Nitrospirillum sp. BR 11828 TaxID=3104325 RepID=UPI002ACA7877|nr:hypothetical protein [Nitrospirillum sp. BR 11828]MDZ5648538.1 hypothetical protein [Nitrospirillum sp. BR 11828]
MMAINIDSYLSETLQQSIIPGIITLIAAGIKIILTPKSRIKWGFSHGFVFSVQHDKTKAPALYYTKTLFIRNSGRAQAENVEIIFGSEPEHFQIWPSIIYKTNKNPEGHFAIQIESLAPGEHFSIEMLSIHELPLILRARSKAGDGENVNFIPMESIKKWKIQIVVLLIWLGIFSIFQNIYIYILK